MAGYSIGNAMWRCCVIHPGIHHNSFVSRIHLIFILERQQYMWSGIFYACMAGMMWGLVFVGPLLLSEYPASLLSVGRYLAFGVIVLIPAWFARHDLAKLSQADWLSAFRLTLIGNFLYYIFLSSAIQRTGGPLAIVIISSLPVVIAITTHLRGKHLADRIPPRQLFFSLLLICFGIAFVNHVELKQLDLYSGAQVKHYLSGALLAALAVGCWAWYAIKNSEWLHAHAEYSPKHWATAQGLVTLPLALLGLGVVWGGSSIFLNQSFSMPLGPRPILFILLMLVIGLCSSWLGTFFWNVASQKIKAAWVGQLIVFEILAALIYTFVLRQEMPSMFIILGVVSLLLGVVCAFQKRSVAT